MAYILHTNNSVLNIAENENEKNDLNLDFSSCTSIEISSDDFNNIKKSLVFFEITGDSVSFTTDPNPGFKNEELLKGHIEPIKDKLKQFTKVKTNSSKILHTAAVNYLNVLNSVDFSTITFPYQKTWEQHCEDNSIQYLNVLQIP
tara:strand:- start:1085 stop:1519 length:435 start_codon:yes stop_codon:yes gene_type:complete